MSSQLDFVIIGQGLAGTTLAWQLFRRGRSVMVADCERGGCSRVAAGLMTPVTGKRLARSWRWDELYPAAVAFYRTVESDTGTTFFHQRPSLRIFANDVERARHEQKTASGTEPVIRPDWFDAPRGGFEMGAARLDVPRYLDASRDHFRAHGAYTTAEIEPCDIELTAAGVRIPLLDIEVGTLVLCRGFDTTADPWFGSIKFNAAKGEILTVRIPDLAEERVVHRGIWLAPDGGEIFRVGSTYTWGPLDALPTAQGRAEIEAKLRAFLRLPFEVLDHRAAVRPVIDAGVPVLGRHPLLLQLAYFNGLGSKGSLLAPFFANQLAAHLCGEGDIEPVLDVSWHRFPGR